MVMIGNYDFKIEDEKERYVSGWASVEVPDIENDIIPVEVLIDAMKEYMGPEFNGDLNYGHTNKKVGKVIYWNVREHPITGHDGIYIIAKIYRNEVADKVWDAIKKGIIKGFSVGGTGHKRKKIIVDDNGVKREVEEVYKLEIHEISLAEFPANQFSMIEAYSVLAKSRDMEDWGIQQYLDYAVKLKKGMIEVYKKMVEVLENSEDGKDLVGVFKEVVSDEERHLSRIESLMGVSNLKKNLEKINDSSLDRYPLLKALLNGEDLRKYIDSKDIIKNVLKDEILAYTTNADDSMLKGMENSLALAIMSMSTYMPNETKYKEGFMKDSDGEPRFSKEIYKKAKEGIEYFEAVMKGLEDFKKDNPKQAIAKRIDEMVSVIQKNLDILKKKGEDKKCKERYYNFEEGHFKGRAGTGERFKNCVKYYQYCTGLSEEGAKRMCGYIARYVKKALDIFKDDSMINSILRDADVDELIIKLRNGEELTDEEWKVLHEVLGVVGEYIDDVDIEGEVPHAREQGKLIATFDEKELADEYAREKGYSVVPTQSGRWAVIDPFENSGDIKKPNDLRPPEAWWKKCMDKVHNARLCAWIYWHELKPHAGKNDDNDRATEEARRRKAKWLEEKVDKADKKRNYSHEKSEYVDWAKGEVKDFVDKYSDAEKKSEIDIPAFVEWTWVARAERGEDVKVLVNRAVDSLKLPRPQAAKLVKRLVDKLDNAIIDVQTVGKDEGMPGGDNEGYVNPVYTGRNPKEPRDFSPRKRAKESKDKPKGLKIWRTLNLDEYTKAIEVNIERLKSNQ